MNVVMILDASGSMANIRNDVLGSVNSFIRDEKDKNSKDLFTLITFNDSVTTQVYRKPVRDVRELSNQAYKTTGSTALFKAIVDTIKSFEFEENVVMVIVTDGQENASYGYTKDQVYKLVQRCKKDKNWTFSYLSADIDTFNQGESLGFGGTHLDGIDVTNRAHCEMRSCNTTVGYGNLGKQISDTTQKCMAMQGNRSKSSSVKPIASSTSSGWFGGLF